MTRLENSPALRVNPPVPHVNLHLARTRARFRSGRASPRSSRVPVELKLKLKFELKFEFKFEAPVPSPKDIVSSPAPPPSPPPPAPSASPSRRPSLSPAAQIPLAIAWRQLAWPPARHPPPPRRSAALRRRRRRRARPPPPAYQSDAGSVGIFSVYSHDRPIRRRKTVSAATGYKRCARDVYVSAPAETSLGLDTATVQSSVETVLRHLITLERIQFSRQFLTCAICARRALDLASHSSQAAAFSRGSRLHNHVVRVPVLRLAVRITAESDRASSPNRFTLDAQRFNASRGVDGGKSTEGSRRRGFDGG
eukprot:152112-Prorocentrum_minimum.AAC.1